MFASGALDRLAVSSVHIQRRCGVRRASEVFSIGDFETVFACLVSMDGRHLAALEVLVLARCHSDGLASYMLPKVALGTNCFNRLIAKG